MFDTVSVGRVNIWKPNLITTIPAQVLIPNGTKPSVGITLIKELGIYQIAQLMVK